MFVQKINSNPWKRVFNDPPAGGSPTTPPTTPATPPTTPGTAGGDRKFSQDEVNTILAKEKRAAQQKEHELLSKLDAAKLAGEEKAALETRLEELRTASMTESDRAKDAAEKAKQRFDTELKAEKAKAENFAKMYTEEKIGRELLDAANEHEAFKPPQMVELLKSKTRLAEEVDAGGKATGKMVVKTKVMATIEGVMKELELTPSEAVKKMKEQPAEFGNLFKTGVAGGLGATGSNGKSGGVDLTSMSQADFNKQWRESKGTLLSRATGNSK